MMPPNKEGAELGGSRAEKTDNAGKIHWLISLINAAQTSGCLMPNIRFSLPSGWKWDDDPFFTVGDRKVICAWGTGPGSCRIQTRISEIARRLERMPDCIQVGYSVAGRWIRIFATPYTLQWVAKNVVARLTLEFLRENEGRFSKNAPGEALARHRHSSKVLVRRAAL